MRTIPNLFGALLLALLPIVPATAGVPETPAESLPAGAQVTAIHFQPEKIHLHGKFDGAQLVAIATLATGDTVDVTRLAALKLAQPIAKLSETGHLVPVRDGSTSLEITIGGKSASVPVQVSGMTEIPKVDFIKDVNPVLSKLGCNQGTCHGAKDGKVGFKLSLRGYDPLFDVRSLKDDLAGRRLNVASPDDSLMLLKAIAAVPHEGGQRAKFGDKSYEIMRAWIADGANLNLSAPRVTKIDLFPLNPVVQMIGAKQQIRVVATYSDGTTRDVTTEAFLESGNGDVAKVDEKVMGLVETLRRGEAPILVRYEGSYAATTLTVMGDRTGFTWQQPETWGRIDELVAAKWQRMKILPSGVCSDTDFLRRVYLDLTGLPPTAEEVRAFLADQRATRVKRDAVVDKLIGSEPFIEHWTNKWADLLQVNSKFLGGQGVTLFRNWIRQEIAANTPYDQFVRKIMTASGSNKEQPAASYWKILREPTETMENTTHLFLATRFNCNKCHDHPFERWTQDQYYELGAFFSRVKLERDPASGNAVIQGTAVEQARPLYEIVKDAPEGEMIHDRTQKVAPPRFPYDAKFEVAATAPRREQLAAWMTSPDNRYFASSYVNRLWGYLLGVGIIEPLDDIRAGNPPSNPELLDYLTKEFIEHQFDVRYVLALICKSRTYQLSVATNRWNEDDRVNYSHAQARRLPAEVLYDAVLKVTGSAPKLPGGVRATMLADSRADLPSGFLANLGRPARESSCECERSSELQLGSVMALLSGPAVAEAIGDPKNEISKLVTDQKDDRSLINELFLRVLNRPATDIELQRTLEAWNAIDQDHQKLLAVLDAKEKEQAPIIAKAEADRLARIEAAKAELARYEAEIAPKIAEAEKKRQQDIAAAEASIADYEQKNLAAAQAAFEATVPVARTYTGWHRLDLVEIRASDGVELTKLPDGSVKASGPKPNRSDYVLKADTNLAGITGLMLEVLPVHDESNNGPGRAADGNFVLTEFSVKVGDAGTGANAVDAKFTGAVADFSQVNFDVAKAIDGKRNDGNNGWAISKQYGVPHFAAFAFDKPVGTPGKSIRLRMELHQPRPGGFQIARLRIWATTDPAPLNIGLPANVAAALRKPATQRSDAEKAAIAAYWKENDPELRKRQFHLARLGAPLPTDPGILQRKAAITEAEKPIRIDPGLLQLRADVEQSKAQLANKRVTGAQDLVWALINTPAFLFNR